MKEKFITEKEIIKTPAGGVLIGKDKEGQTIIPNSGSMGGFLVGNLHKNGGIKAVVKSTGQPIEMQSNEVVITSPAVADTKKRMFEGKMMTNREILSKINEDGGGVSFAEGGDISVKASGKSYQYGGKLTKDCDILKDINSCGCEHSMKLGGIAKGKSFKAIAKMHNVPLSEINKQLKMGMKIESEHTKNKAIQRLIARDHLFENPQYYTILKKAKLSKGTLIKKEEKGVSLQDNNYDNLADAEDDGIVGNSSFALGGEVKDKEKQSFDSEGSSEGKGKLYEFFTPQLVADKMLALAEHYGFKGGNVLEPACGSGRLIKHLKNCNITAFEINKDNFEILQNEFPNAELYNFNFEKAFLKEPRFNSTINRKATKSWIKNTPFDLVLANPPYGKFSGLYSSYFSFKGQVEHFFILQSLYLLKSGGLGVYLIPSSFLRNGITYNSIKEEIFKISDFVDAYRMPSNIFKKTQIGTDILILRKK